MSDTLYLFSRAMCNIEGGGVMTNRFVDWARPGNKDPEPTETAEEIVARFCRELGVNKNECL